MRFARRFQSSAPEDLSWWPSHHIGVWARVVRQRPGPTGVTDMDLFLFEHLAHFFGQFVKQLSNGGIIKVAGVLRKNLAREDRDRLTMARGLTDVIGIDHFAAGKHPR
jgi:hypothetical protein